MAKSSRSLIGHPTYFTSSTVFLSAIVLRLVLLLYGLFQDAYSPLKYTDIDYLVFTDAARYVSHGQSPYERETYRYTPLLAWLLLPTNWPGTFWFSFGKILFGAADIIAGWLIVLVLRSPAGGVMSLERSLKFASIWLLNPMVATISTRGSSEGLLGVMVMALLWAVTRRRVALAGILLGFGVHLKIYPFIYAPSLFLYLETPSDPEMLHQPADIAGRLRRFLNKDRIILTFTSLITLTALNALMYSLYGHAFLQHTFLHHLTRIDHRHNFSPYNTLLYLSSANGATNPANSSRLSFESLAFIPQLSLSAVLIPLVLAKRDLPGTMLAQTWAFVALNKVCTSQYFLWYLVLLPLYLPSSSFLASTRLGITALGLWIAAQALWLQQGYQLEFLGKSNFVPGLWGSSLLFYAVNMWILGVIVGDIGSRNQYSALKKESNVQ